MSQVKEREEWQVSVWKVKPLVTLLRLIRKESGVGRKSFKKKMKLKLRPEEFLN